MSPLFAYFISGLIGFFVGLEREKSQPPSNALGVRTFLLLGLLGAVAGGLEQIAVSIALAVFSFILIIVSYTRSRNGGLTTEFAAALVFCLGFLAHTQPIPVAIMGPLLALILASKRGLHKWTKELKTSELQAAALLLLLAVTVLNVIPDKTVDPWQLFNPRKFGYIVFALAALEFGSYVLVKIFGHGGSVLTGFLGGFVSSTAVTLSVAKSVAHNRMHWQLSLKSAVAAILASLVELIILLSLVSLPLTLKLLPATLAPIIIGVGFLFFYRQPKEETQRILLKSPLDFKGVLRLSLLMAAILTAVALIQRWLGPTGTLLMSLLTGSFELHGLSLATATLHKQSLIPMNLAFWSLIIGIEASLAAKTFIAWIVGNGIFAKRFSFAAGMMGIGTLLGAWLY